MEPAGPRVGALPAAILEAARTEGQPKQKPGSAPVVGKIGTSGPAISMENIPAHAFADLNKKYPLTKDMTVEEQRDRGAKIMEELASGSWKQAAEIVVSQPTVSQPVAQPQQASSVFNGGTTTVDLAPAMVGSPIAPVMHVASEQAVSMFSSAKAAQSDFNAEAGAPKPPSHAVRIEVQGSPMQYEAYYHQIIGTPSCIVLISDDRCVGYPKAYFKPEEGGPQVCIQIAGQDVFYLVQPTKYQFTLDNWTVTVLDLINKFPVAT